ncbi:MAG: hypothetical protein UC662_00520 [Paraprevotella clara]|nr:hypothetical protein [Paraprevotella clara]
MKRRILMLAVCLVGFFSLSFSQIHRWTQWSLSGGYESFAHTFEKGGKMFSADFDLHFNSRWYGSLLVGMSGYEGQQTDVLHYPDEDICDIKNDKKTQILFGIGPGFDLFGNQLDRFYAVFYGGYAIVKYDYEYHDENNVKQFPDENKNGFMGMLRLGYEHQFGRSFTMGVFGQGEYAGGELNWGLGLRLGWRYADFHKKKVRK